MTTKSFGKKSASKVVMKTPKNQNKNVKGSASRKDIVSENESAEEAFFQDSDDAEMDWSEADNDNESFEDSGSEDEEDSDSLDSEEEFIDDDEEEEDDEDTDEDFIEEDFNNSEESEIDDDSSSSDEKSFDIKEKDLVISTAVSHANNPLLQFFWKLSDTSKDVRYEAVSGLIAQITASQSAFVASPVSVPSKKENVLSLYDSGLLSGKCCSDLTYTVKRLIKGLASSRDSSRFGFMLALLTVYHSFLELLDAEVILNWSMKLTSSESLGGSIKRREERLLYVARIFALGALFRSKLGTLLSVSSKQSAIDSLISVGKKKSFLRESALEIIISVVDCAESDELSEYAFKKLAASSALNTETLAFSIIASTRFGLALNKSKIEIPVFMSEFSDLKTIMSSSNEEPLINVLKETPCFENRLHSIWDLVFGFIDTNGCMSSEVFLKRVIEAMFLNSTGMLKRWTGLNLLKKLINLKKDSSIGFVFSPVVIRMIQGALGNLNVKSSALAGKEVVAFNAAVIDLFRGLVLLAAESTDQTCSEILLDLIINLSKVASGTSGKKLLEEIAGDQAIMSKLYLRLSTPNVIVLINNIAKDISIDFDTNIQSLILFQIPFDKLLALVSNENLVKLESSSDWINHLINVFAKFYLESKNEEIREVIKGRFFALLNELADSKRFSGVNWIDQVATILLEYISGTNSHIINFEVDEPTSDALNNLKNVEKLLNKQKIEPERFGQAIVLLKNYLAILLFLDPLETIPVCLELSDCLKNNFASKSSKKSKDNANLDVVIPVIVDILMTFLAKPSQLTRKMCDDIFRAIVPFLTSHSLSILLQILKTVDSEKDNLFEEVSGSISASEDEEEENSGSNGDSFDEIMKPCSESELSDVDDDEMMAFDEKLVEIFKEKKKALSGFSSAKARAQESKRSMIQFKFKVLELVNLAFKSGDLSVSVRIGSINGLLEVLFSNLSSNKSPNTSEQKQFFSKLESFFTETFGRAARNPNISDAESAQVLICELIDRIRSEEKIICHGAVLPRAAQCVLFLVKICRNLKVDETNIKSKFAELIKFALSSNENHFRVLRSFVFTWSNWDLQYVAPLLPTMIDELKSLFIVGAIRPYQRNQLNEFLTSLIKRAPSFNEKASAIKLLELFSLIFTEIYLDLSNELKQMKADFFKDDLKFIQFCYKKHCEFDSEAGPASWKSVLTTGLSNVEAIWIPQANTSNSVKSLLGQIKSLKQ